MKDEKGVGFTASALTVVVSGLIGLLMVVLFIPETQHGYMLPFAFLVSIFSVLLSYPLYNKIYSFLLKSSSKQGAKEPHVVINGVTLTEAQSMTLRVAIESFDQDLRSNGLGNDRLGVTMTAAYMDRVSEIRLALYPACDD